MSLPWVYLSKKLVFTALSAEKAMRTFVPFPSELRLLVIVNLLWPPTPQADDQVNFHEFGLRLYNLAKIYFVPLFIQVLGMLVFIFIWIFFWRFYGLV